MHPSRKSDPKEQPRVHQRSFGHMRLRTVLQDQQLPRSFSGAPVVAQFSSLGSTDGKWMDEFKDSLSAGKHGAAGEVVAPDRLGQPFPRSDMWQRKVKAVHRCQTLKGRSSKGDGSSLSYSRRPRPCGAVQRPALRSHRPYI